MTTKTYGDEQIVDGAVKALKTSKNTLAISGWCKQSLGSSTGEMCMVGAVNNTVLGDPYADRFTMSAECNDTYLVSFYKDVHALAIQALQDVVSYREQNTETLIADFNDKDSTDITTVFKVFDEAIETLQTSY